MNKIKYLFIKKYKQAKYFNNDNLAYLIFFSFYTLQSTLISFRYFFSFLKIDSQNLSIFTIYAFTLQKLNYFLFCLDLCNLIFTNQRGFLSLCLQAKFKL